MCIWKLSHIHSRKAQKEQFKQIIFLKGDLEERVNAEELPTPSQNTTQSLHPPCKSNRYFKGRKLIENEPVIEGNRYDLRSFKMYPFTGIRR